MSAARAMSVGLLLLTAAPLAGCTLERQREEIRAGILQTGQFQELFRELWGLPERTVSATGEEVIRAGLGGGFGGFSGFFFKGKETYNLWFYRANEEIALVFSGTKRKYLVSWNTQLTTKQLAEFGRSRQAGAP
ncbi:MAG: hypothetical protein JXA90_10495 [Planctomycetes bacterium]|nr:hypothetical protein [Planctomycetota bacterium]